MLAHKGIPGKEIATNLATKGSATIFTGSEAGLAITKIIIRGEGAELMAKTYQIR